MGRKENIRKEMGEFYITHTKGKYLNEKISKFRVENPLYEIFNISAYGTGGQYGGTIRYSIIWRRELK